MGKNPEPGLHLQARQILLGARDLVRSGWSSGAAARDGDGRPVGPLHSAARSWSLSGAIEAASATRIEVWSDESWEKAREIAEVALATAIGGGTSETGALRGLNRAIRETSEPGAEGPSTTEREMDGPRVAREIRRAGRASGAARCGICTRELPEEGLHLETAGRTLGSFCSQGCLAAARVLAALERWAAELDGRGRRDEAQTREALADQLLFLWRRRVGPDPKIVARAVQLARERGGPTLRPRLR